VVLRCRLAGRRPPSGVWQRVRRWSATAEAVADDGVERAVGSSTPGWGGSSTTTCARRRPGRPARGRGRGAACSMAATRSSRRRCSPRASASLADRETLQGGLARSRSAAQRTQPLSDGAPVAGR